MFKSSRGRGDSPGLSHSPQSQAMSGKRGMFSVIGPDVTITGNVAATADLHVDGRIDGDLDCGNLVQGIDSRINGTVRAEIARLAGTIDGSVSVRQLTVERAARITGDVEYETISIENGASIDGRLKHIAADAGGRNFDRTAVITATPIAEIRHDERISLVSSNGAAA